MQPTLFYSLNASNSCIKNHDPAILIRYCQQLPVGGACPKKSTCQEMLKVVHK